MRNREAYFASASARKAEQLPRGWRRGHYRGLPSGVLVLGTPELGGTWVDRGWRYWRRRRSLVYRQLGPAAVITVVGMLVLPRDALVIPAALTLVGLPAGFAEWEGPLARLRAHRWVAARVVGVIARRTYGFLVKVCAPGWCLGRAARLAVLRELPEEIVARSDLDEQLEKRQPIDV